MARLARLRNLIVHGTGRIDDMRAYLYMLPLYVKRNGLGLVRRFIQEAREYVVGHREG